MTTRLTHRYTTESLKQLEKPKLDIVRANAERLGALDLVAMCDSELTARRPARSGKSASVDRTGDVVVGYHFVCERDLGVTQVGGGQFWSGSWVVAAERVQESLAAGAYLALHEAKSEPSYRQGTIIGFRKAPRDMVAKRNEGIEFLVKAASLPISWVGDAAGEKGYKWEALRRRGLLED